MESTQRYTLGKAEKLKSRKTIDLLFKAGKSFSNFPFKVIWDFNEAGGIALQAGFAVGSKHFKKAVDRNRIKRLMREAYRLQKNELQGQLTAQQKKMVVFLIYIGNEIPEYQLVFEKTGNALSRLIKKVHENSIADT